MLKCTLAKLILNRIDFIKLILIKIDFKVIHKVFDNMFVAQGRKRVTSMSFTPFYPKK